MEVQTEADAMLERQKKELMPPPVAPRTPRTPRAPVAPRTPSTPRRPKLVFLHMFTDILSHVLFW